MYPCASAIPRGFIATRSHLTSTWPSWRAWHANETCRSGRPGHHRDRRDGRSRVRAPRRPGRSGRDDRVFVLDADLADSDGAFHFAMRHPRRFMMAGIAEQGMISTAAGMAEAG